VQRLEAAPQILAGVGADGAFGIAQRQDLPEHVQHLRDLGLAHAGRVRGRFVHHVVERGGLVHRCVPLSLELCPPRASPAGCLREVLLVVLVAAPVAVLLVIGRVFLRGGLLPGALPQVVVALSHGIRQERIGLLLQQQAAHAAPLQPRHRLRLLARPPEGQRLATGAEPRANAELDRLRDQVEVVSGSMLRKQ